MPDEITSRGSKRESRAAQGRANALSWRDRVAGAVLVLIVLAAQTRWMGLAIILLSGGLVLAYGVWVAARWKNDAATVLPIYLLAIAVGSGSTGGLEEIAVVGLVEHEASQLADHEPFGCGAQ